MLQTYDSYIMTFPYSDNSTQSRLLKSRVSLYNRVTRLLFDCFYFLFQLDKSIVVSFVGTYPHESKRIHMGKVEANDIDNDDYSIPAPRRKRNRKPLKKGKKVAPKKSAAAAKKALKVPPKSGKKGVIVVNGRPVTGEYVSPALKKKTGPVKKRAAANYGESDDEDSDIEVIGTLAPPPLKKRKTGTKSRY